MGGCSDPDENLHCCEEGRGDDGVEGPDASVGYEVGDEPPGQISGVHRDEEVDGGGRREVEDFLAEGGDLYQGRSAGECHGNREHCGRLLT